MSHATQEMQPDRSSYTVLSFLEEGNNQWVACGRGSLHNHGPCTLTLLLLLQYFLLFSATELLHLSEHFLNPSHLALSQLGNVCTITMHE
jgi:hypothetical protein